MIEALRGSAAHVFVTDLGSPVLDDTDARHLFRVLRLRDGEPVTAGDGHGSWRQCVVAGGALAAVGEVSGEARRDPPLTIAVAVPKGDRPEWIVQKLTEIGIDRIVFIHAARSVVHWSSERATRQLERLRRVGRAAAAQSRRLWLPEVDGPEPAKALLRLALVAEPGGRRLAPGDSAVAIGPEGGWTPEELAVASDTVDLGQHVMRVETAALAAAVLLVAARR